MVNRGKIGKKYGTIEGVDYRMNILLKIDAPRVVRQEDVQLSPSHYPYHYR